MPCRLVLYGISTLYNCAELLKYIKYNHCLNEDSDFIIALLLNISLVIITQLNKSHLAILHWRSSKKNIRSFEFEDHC